MAEKDAQGKIEDLWLIKPCEIYKEEYYDCKKFFSRFYQYYIDGAWSDCSHWLTDYNNCMKYRKTKDPQAAEEVIESEKQRRKARLSAARANNIWEYRTSPPSQWFAPLDKDQDSVQR